MINFDNIKTRLEASYKKISEERKQKMSSAVKRSK